MKNNGEIQPSQIAHIEQKLIQSEKLYMPISISKVTALMAVLRIGLVKILLQANLWTCGYSFGREIFNMFSDDSLVKDYL